jgi:eukaryotic-like serine/threonine-protein kinase
MSITDPHVLAADVTLVRVRDLKPAVRALLQCDNDAWAISRPSGRAATKIIGAAAGELLDTFAAPRLLTEVVAERAAERQVDPLAYFDSARAFLEQMIDVGFLVEVGSAREQPPRPMFARGDRVGCWKVIACLHFLDDVDVYQARAASGRCAALKIARVSSAGVTRLIRREAAILRALRGTAAPRLLGMGALNGRSWFASEWCAGTDAETAAAEIRSLPSAERYRRMCALLVSITEAYERLHARRVVHGDVHMKNVRVDAQGKVRLLDFGWSRQLGRGKTRARILRVGAGFLFEPEFARAWLAKRQVPQATPHGEQYVLATMLDALWTGMPPFDFSVRVDEAWRQIVEDTPQSFAARGVEPAPEIERILRRAMKKRPADRFASVAEFARALRAAGDSHSAIGLALASGRTSAGQSNGKARLHRSRSIDFAKASDRLVEKLRLTGSALRDAASRAPTCSLSTGAAGIAFALNRIAIVRGDAVALAWADVWAARAESGMTLPYGLTADQPGLSHEEIGPISLLHAAPGVHLARGLVSDARGEHAAARVAVRAFVQVASTSSQKTDLTHGRAGTLLGIAQLIESTAAGAASARLRALGSVTCRELWGSLAREPRIGDSASRLDLGMAHGWSGILFATLRWCQSSGTRVLRALSTRLAELAACADPFGRGVRWHLFIRGAPDLPRGRYVAGWCKGAAGLAQLWFLAAAILDDRRARALAVGSAWHAWESDVDSGPFLCCGLAGRAYTMLAAWRHTGDDAWLTKARTLTQRALLTARRNPQPRDEARPESLYFGDLGLALLAAELAVPQAARMPLLERVD